MRVYVNLCTPFLLATDPKQQYLCIVKQRLTRRLYDRPGATESVKGKSGRVQVKWRYKNFYKTVTATPY